MKTKLLLLSVLFVLLSCDDDVKITNQRVFFEVHYINGAWGYVNHGVLIDSLGNVSSFNLPSGSDWNYPDSLGNISRLDMNENFALCDSVVYNVSSYSLQHYVNMIDSAAKGKVTGPAYGMVDAGIKQYFAYVYNYKSDSYKQIVLYQWGDVPLENDAPTAAVLTEWLSDMFQFGKYRYIPPIKN